MEKLKKAIEPLEKFNLNLWIKMMLDVGCDFSKGHKAIINQGTIKKHGLRIPKQLIDSGSIFVNQSMDDAEMVIFRKPKHI